MWHKCNGNCYTKMVQYMSSKPGWLETGIRSCPTSEALASRKFLKEIRLEASVALSHVLQHSFIMTIWNSTSSRNYPATSSSSTLVQPNKTILRWDRNAWEGVLGEPRGRHSKSRGQPLRRFGSAWWWCEQKKHKDLVQSSRGSASSNQWGWAAELDKVGRRDA